MFVAIGSAPSPAAILASMSTFVQCLPAAITLAALFTFCAYQVRRRNRMNEERRRQWREAEQKKSS
jgi:hypothetical protein